MRIKTFTAGSYDAALDLVRDHFGADGVVLHTRSYKRGGLLGLGGRTVVEVTASAGRELGKRNRAQASRSPRAEAVRAMDERRATREADRREVLAGDLIKKTYAAAKQELSAAETPTEAAGVATATAPDPMPAPAVAVVPPGVGDDRLSEEVAAVKRMVRELMHRPGPPAEGEAEAVDASALPDGLAEPYLAMLEAELSREIADAVLAEVRDGLGESGADDAERCREAMAAALAQYLPGEAEARRWPTDGRPLTIALVGPTGVGKTTTVAKLAAGFKLHEAKSVGLVTIDTYRIAAVEQLKTYADIIDVPLEVVKTPEEMAEAMHRLRDRDVVLIDTAGRSPKDADRLSALREVLKPARVDETHLVLSSVSAQRTMLDALDRFEPLGYDRVLFTKLDEAVTVGVMFTAMRRVNRSMSYITTGQEVPHRIEAATPRRLAELALGGDVR
ncbi:MAG: flagellar biosynthesis protein FlhF [Planctomycetota bacterium]